MHHPLRDTELSREHPKAAETVHMTGKLEKASQQKWHVELSL